MLWAKSKFKIEHEENDFYPTENINIIRICTECPLPASDCSKKICKRFREERDKIRGYSYGKNKQKQNKKSVL